MTIAAIIVAAGRGTRAGGEKPKQWQNLNGASALSHTVAAFAQARGVDLIVVVLHPDDFERAADLGQGVQIVAGGATRTASVRAALEALDGQDVTRVLIHDGARPLVSTLLIARMIAALDSHAAAAPALILSDALWQGVKGYVAGHQDRSGLYRAQTPQAFDFASILAAHRDYKGQAADDVEVARAAGLDVAIIEGEEENLKLTYPRDFHRAERLMADRDTKGRQMDIRLGNGFDVHAFCDGDHLWLCGVKIPHSRGLLGHSDADVGMHALTDAIYGALALGDIGQHFPPSDPQWKGAASHIFLRHAAAQAAKRGFRLGNADVTLVCETPKIGPHAQAMRAALAEIMEVTVDRISVKATTSEKLGFTGREEGIAALATVSLVQA
jgi:2-C-methyl-D-erythritol 4-phosphate cytidylyltransferase/2-C-methyl-D-erythritol 2,4-cyclodiphosphate synthase